MPLFSGELFNSFQGISLPCSKTGFEVFQDPVPPECGVPTQLSKLDTYGKNATFFPILTQTHNSANDNDGLKKIAHDASTLTDICNNQELPEVEIISLIEEHIPRYRLRADTLTRFSGYENEDWFIPAPALSADSDVDLSPEQAEETLKYFTLCANRVSQMTKTYNDVDAVTRLLEEKEKDLELAARIGQSLLSRNRTLEQKNEHLEQEVSLLTEQVTQIRHELTMKTELLQIYAHDLNYSESDSSANSPTRDRISLHINWEVLQKKVRQLEEENHLLRNEASELDSETVSFEEKEQQLVKDCVTQLAEANEQINQLSEELSKRIDDNLRQQEEITNLLAQLVESQKKIKKYQADNEELQNHLQAAKECQQELTTELSDFKEKYGEIADLLRDTQEQLRTSRRKGMPSATKRPQGFYSPYINPDSLASELENSLSSDNNSFDNFAQNEKQQHSLKVFETVRYTRQQNQMTPSSYSSPAHLSHLYSSTTSGSIQSSCNYTYPNSGQTAPICMTGVEVTSCLSSPYPASIGPSSLDGISDSESSVLTDNYSADDDSLYSSTTSLGRPGIPGSNDLEVALRRLSLRRQSEQEYQLHDRQRFYDLGSDGTHSPRQCRTPDSIMSTGSAHSGLSGGQVGYRHYHMPEKLQIIKPMEGSLTLHHWQRLATPHLGGIFEERPGVQIKGERKLEDLDDVYTLTDYEEDEDYIHPGKSFESTGTIYTYTTSTVLHPDDNTQVTPSLPPTQMSIKTQNGPLLNSPQSRERATSTFSTTLSLAKLLNERGIGAALPRVVSRPSSPSCAFSPTATPCNSPEGSPPPSPPPFSPLRLPSVVTLTSGVYRGADLLRKRLNTRSKSNHSGHKPSTSTGTTGTSIVASSTLNSSTPTVPSLTNINLLEKLNRIGLENIMATCSTTPTKLTLPSNPLVNRTSPMAQLTSLRRHTTTPSLSVITSSASQPHITPATASSLFTQDLGTIGTMPNLRKGGLL